MGSKILLVDLMMVTVWGQLVRTRQLVADLVGC